jgi:PTH1 family peptidyl-tRNA hydrolase
MSVDKTADMLGVEFKKEKCRALLAETKIGTEKIILAKPLTYMNLSGESVRELLSFYKIGVEDLLVIYDDYDLKKGTIRIRKEGSAGTHNGMKNIVKEIGSEKFKRVRIGFMQDGEVKIPLINYVLSGIKKEEEGLFSKATTVAGEIAKAFAMGENFDKIMQKYNGNV